MLPGSRYAKAAMIAVIVIIVLGLVLAGLIHIVAVLALPSLAPKNGFSRFAALGPVNTVIQIPPAAPGQQPMPMMAT